MKRLTGYESPKPAAVPAPLAALGRLDASGALDLCFQPVLGGFVRRYLSLAIALTAVFTSGGPAHAATTCEPIETIHKYDLYNQKSVPGSSSTYIEGVSGLITARQSKTCTGTSSYNYVMGGVHIWETEQSVVHHYEAGQGLAFVGWIRYSTSSALTYFTQYTSADFTGYVNQTHGSLSPGASATYKVHYCPSGTCSGKFAFSIGGAQKTTTNYGPFSTWGDWELWWASWGVIITRLNSDVPGLVGSTMNHTNLQIQRFTSDQFVAADTVYFGAQNDNPARWALGGVLNNTFDVACIAACG